MKQFLILQLREEDGAANSEFEAFLRYGQLDSSDVHRVRMERESFADLNPEDYAGILVGGGLSNVSDNESAKPDYQLRFEKELNSMLDRILDMDIPYFGSCYGLGALVKHTGGLVSKERYSEEVGYVKIKLNEGSKQDPLLVDSPKDFNAFCGHKEACQTLPAGAVLLAGSDSCPVQMVRFGSNIYATQFHCELDAQGIGERILFYKNDGYFDPESAEELILKTKKVTTDAAHAILRRFVDRYRV